MVTFVRRDLRPANERRSLAERRRLPTLLGKLIGDKHAPKSPVDWVNRPRRNNAAAPPDSDVANGARHATDNGVPTSKRWRLPGRWMEEQALQPMDVDARMDAVEGGEGGGGRWSAGRKVSSRRLPSTSESYRLLSAPGLYSADEMTEANQTD